MEANVLFVCGNTTMESTKAGWGQVFNITFLFGGQGFAHLCHRHSLYQKKILSFFGKHGGHLQYPIVSMLCKK